MKRSLSITLLFGIFFLLHIHAQANDHVRSYPQEAYAQALDEARLEGKLILLDFTAKWCTPCRWMKNTTFKDPHLTNYLSERYIIVHIDIDDFEGYTLKEKYNVTLLPTFIILSSEGQILTKLEESMGATKMYNICRSYDNRQNTAAPSSNKKPAIPQRQVRLSSPETSNDRTPAKAPVSSNDTPTSSNNNESRYQLQLGVFSDFTNASKLADKVFEDFSENMEIKNINGKFKVLLGYFESREEAIAKKEELNQKSYDAIIIEI